MTIVKLRISIQINESVLYVCYSAHPNVYTPKQTINLITPSYQSGDQSLTWVQPGEGFNVPVLLLLLHVPRGGSSSSRGGSSSPLRWRITTTLLGPRVVLWPEASGQEDELVRSVGSALFALGRQSPDHALQVGRLGDDHHLGVGPGGVGHDVDAVREGGGGGLGRAGWWWWWWCGWRWSMMGVFRRGVAELERQLPPFEDQGSAGTSSHLCFRPQKTSFGFSVWRTNVSQDE